MDWIKIKSIGILLINKYKYVLIILLTGIFLMLLPSEKEETLPQITSEKPQPSLQESLSQILSLVDGAGKVEVLLTVKAGEETIYQINQDLSSSEHSTDRQLETVIMTNGSREESGLIKQTNPPVYLGAIVLCQGADNNKVKLSIVEAVKSVTGLPSNCISVLKMK